MRGTSKLMNALWVGIKNKLKSFNVFYCLNTAVVYKNT